MSMRGTKAKRESEARTAKRRETHAKKMAAAKEVLVTAGLPKRGAETVKPRGESFVPPATVTVCLQFQRTWYKGANSGTWQFMVDDSVSDVTEQETGRALGAVGAAVGYFTVDTARGEAHYAVGHREVWQAFADEFDKQIELAKERETVKGAADADRGEGL